MKNVYNKDTLQALINFKGIIRVNDYLFVGESLNLIRIPNTIEVKEYFKLFDFCKSENQNEIETFLSIEDIVQLNKNICNQIIKTKYKPVMSKLNNTYTSIILNLTYNCNLKCTYCFEKQCKSKGTMLPETGIKSIDFLIRLNPSIDKYTIVFFGGEPLLNFNTLKEVVKYCESLKHKRFKYSITTNGTIINDEIIAFFKEHNFNIIVSVDGNEKIQNENRPFVNGNESFFTVFQNIKRMEKEGISFLSRSTVVPEKSNLIDIAIFFENAEIEFDFEYVINTNSSMNIYNTNNIENINKQYQELLEFYLERLNRNKKIHWKSFISKIKRIHFRLGKGIVCSSGVSSLTVNSDGNIFSCQNLSYDNIYNVGSIYKGINYDLLTKYLPEKIDDIVKCKDCTIRYLCAGVCVAETLILSQQDCTTNSYRCEIKKNMWMSFLAFYTNKIVSHPFLEKLENGKPNK